MKELRAKLIKEWEIKFHIIWVRATFIGFLVSIISVYRHGSKSILDLINNPIFSWSIYILFPTSIISLILLYLFEQRKSQVGEVILKENEIIIMKDNIMVNEFFLEKISTLQTIKKDPYTYQLNITDKSLQYTYFFTVKNDSELDTVKNILISWKTLYPKIYITDYQ